MRCAMCNRIMNSSFDDYEGGLCARCAHQDMRSTTITFPIDDDLVYREPITPPQEPSSIPCIICGEDVAFHKMDMPWVICDNCKKAVLHVREKLKGKGGNVYTVNEVANALRVNPATIFRALAKGKINGIKIGNIWRISEEEFERIKREGF